MPRRIARALALLGAVVLALAAQAQSFPSRPVQLIVPFPPGGAVDQAGRAIAGALSSVWKQPVVINTRPGAGGAVGMAAAAAAKPDGYTLLAAHPALLSIPEAEALFGRTASFDRRSFTPLALLVADPVIIVVKGDARWRNLEEFIADARKNPDAIPYGSSGAYSAVHLPIEMLAQAAGIKLKHVPYSGGGPALAAVLGGHVAATVGVPAVMAPQIRSGTLRALAATGAKRVALLPEVPTALERGQENVEFYLWVGLFAAKLPDDLAAAIRRDIGRAVVEPEFKANMAKLGAPLDYRDGPAFADFLERDAARISAAIRRIGRVE